MIWFLVFSFLLRGEAEAISSKVNYLPALAALFSVPCVALLYCCNSVQLSGFVLLQALPLEGFG